MQALNESDVIGRLAEIDRWDFANNSLIKTFQLKDFAYCIAFIVKIGIEAEKLDHHPDILLHGWNKVKLTLSTHSAGGVTENDFKLAHKIDQID